MAHHFTQAGLPETAIEWWGRAGSRAMHRFANHEAALSYVNGLDLMADLPASEERDRQELAYRLALGPALLAARGYASDEVERNYQEAGRLAEALSDREAAFTSARGQWHYLYDRSELDRALALAERLRAIGAQEFEHREKQPCVPRCRLDSHEQRRICSRDGSFRACDSLRQRHTAGRLLCETWRRAAHCRAAVQGAVPRRSRLY